MKKLRTKAKAAVKGGFGTTMEEVWKEQKLADAQTVNSNDDDPDME